MLVQYQYVTWSPPNLTDADELELGRQIALLGREHFVRDFRPSIGKAKPNHQRQGGIGSWPPFARWAYITVFSSLCLFGLALMDWRARRGLFAAIVMVLGIYFVSVYFATRKFEKWIDRLVARYAAHVARGGK